MAKKVSGYLCSDGCFYVEQEIADLHEAHHHLTLALNAENFSVSEIVRLLETYPVQFRSFLDAQDHFQSRYANAEANAEAPRNRPYNSRSRIDPASNKSTKTPSPPVQP